MAKKLEIERRVVLRDLEAANDRIFAMDEGGKKRKHELALAQLKKETEAEKARALAVTLQVKQAAAVSAKSAKTAAIQERQEHGRKLASEKNLAKESLKKKREEVAFGRLHSAFGNIMNNFPQQQMMGMMGFPHQMHPMNQMPPMMASNSFAYGNPISNQMMGEPFVQMHNRFKERMDQPPPLKESFDSDVASVLSTDNFGNYSQQNKNDK